ncbi:MAG: hypothetical protein NVS3B7_00980 [Candidatus Elarobacter sp.]
MAITIKVRTNGPYLITGDLSDLALTDAQNNRYDLAGQHSVALCRCGGSTSKPFCDGTHSKIGFQGAESAVRSGSAKDGTDR